jgi:aspartyl aminopeptidase
LLLDKEEIGSEGNTGAKTKLIEEFIEEIIALSGEKITVNNLLSKSNCLSGDVSAAYDPHYKEVFEDKNSARLNKGLAINKYTGVGGKSGSSDASAEFMGKIRNLFNSNSIKWQTAELGKVDVGGGGTVAKYFAERGMEVIDCGPSLLSMHAPYEISSKADVYETYRAYLTFFKNFI